MKALIFNSGLGSRLGKLTEHHPKSMVQLANGESIFGRQLRILYSCGIRDFVITTGPFAEQLQAVAKPFEQRGCTFCFVPNDVYDKTNYIYSMWLAREELRDSDFLLLHGDLVFDAEYAQMIIDSPLPSLGSVNPSLPQPEKDFKARVINGMVREVGVNIFDQDCVAFQAFYKLSQQSMSVWLDAVDRFVAEGTTGVYAENAANTVFEAMGVAAFSYEGHLCEEIDTPEDLERVSEMARLSDFRQQPVLMRKDNQLSLLDGVLTGKAQNAQSIADLLTSLGATHPMVVADPFFANGFVQGLLDPSGLPYEVFSGYAPNPTYDQVLAGTLQFRESGCDALLSVGGGSAIDVAKCIKLYAPMNADGVEKRFVDLPYSFSPIPHVAMPTTAGTGSESTHFAVLYVNGVKNSIAQPCLQPDATVLDGSVLVGLPPYQKKATALDALAQAIESYWSRRSSEESRAYSEAAIPAIMHNVDAYLDGSLDAARKMALAANRAGKAINLTTTTAAHAMSYKLTSLYGFAHGHAVALCLPFTWKLLLEEGDASVQARLSEIDALMTDDVHADKGSGLQAFENLFDRLDLPKGPDEPGDHLDELVSSVNIQRLSNFPVAIDSVQLRQAYEMILFR